MGFTMISSGCNRMTCVTAADHLRKFPQGGMSLLFNLRGRIALISARDISCPWHMRVECWMSLGRWAVRPPEGDPVVTLRAPRASRPLRDEHLALSPSTRSTSAATIDEKHICSYNHPGDQPPFRLSRLPLLFRFKLLKAVRPIEALERFLPPTRIWSDYEASVISCVSASPRSA